MGHSPILRARILNASVRSSVQNALDIDMPCRYGSSLCCMGASVKKRRARKATNSKHGNPTQNKDFEAKFNSVKAKEVVDFFKIRRVRYFLTFSMLLLVYNIKI